MMGAFIGIVLILGGMFSLSNMRTSATRVKAIKAGDMDSYITLANICADAFQADVEWQTVSVYAGLENPDGWDTSVINYEVFDKVIETMQFGDGTKPGLVREMVAGSDAWKYALTTPATAISYAGVTDADTLSLTSRLLKNADVDITVLSGLEYFNPHMEDSDEVHDTEQVMQLSDITYVVTLKKGTMLVKQEYVLSGELLRARYSASNVTVAVDGSNAENRLVTQTAMRNYAE